MKKMNKLILMSFVTVLTVLNLDAKKIKIINSTDHEVTVRAQAKYKMKNSFGMQGKVRNQEAIFIIKPEKIANFKYKKNLKFVELMNPQAGDRIINQYNIYLIINNLEYNENDQKNQNEPNLNQPNLNEEGFDEEDLDEDDFIDQEEYYNEDEVVEAYLELGLLPDASRSQIKRTYHQLVLKNHPDKNSDPEAAETFKRVQNAYDILMVQFEGQDI